MSAHHHVDAGNPGDHLLVADVADMGQRDDLVDTLAFELLDLGRDGLDVVGDGDVGSGRSDFGGVGGDRADDADLLAADFKHH